MTIDDDGKVRREEKKVKRTETEKVEGKMSNCPVTEPRKLRNKEN